MNRRDFLRAIVTIGAAAAIPPALIPAWKYREPQYLTFRGRPIVYDEACMNNRIYFSSKDGPYFVSAAKLDVEAKKLAHLKNYIEQMRNMT